MSYYNCRSKSIKWRKQIFYFGIELAISNSSILYLLSNPQITEMTDLKYKEKLVNDILNEYKDYMELSKNPKTYIPRQYLNLLYKAKYTNKPSNCIKCLASGKRRQVNIRYSVEICHRHPMMNILINVILKKFIRERLFIKFLYNFESIYK